MESKGSISFSAAKGSFWLLSSKFGARLLGLFRTFVLARLLLPEDFGIIGITMLTVSLVEMFTESGFGNALIQKKGSVDKYLDTAWTFSIIRSILLFLLIFFIAPIVANFFNAPVAKNVMRVFSFTIILSAMRNPGTIYFLKDLDLSKQFLIDILIFFFNTLFAVAVALIYRSVWALVLGGMAGTFTLFVMSYIMHGYRPRLRLDMTQVRELYSYGKWVSLSFVLYYFISNGANIVVGRVLGASLLGLYQMAMTMGNLAASEISSVISTITFSAYARMQDDTERLKKAFLKVSQFVLLLVIPATVGLFFLAPEIFAVALGPKWISATTTARILCVSGFVLALGTLANPVFNAVARPDISTKLQVIQLITLACLIYPFCHFFGMEGAAFAITFCNIIYVGGCLISALRILQCRKLEFVRTWTVPIIGSLFMLMILSLCRYFLNTHSVLNLCLLILSGLAAYISAALLIDRLFKTGIVSSIRELAKG